MEECTQWQLEGTRNLSSVSLSAILELDALEAHTFLFESVA